MEDPIPPHPESPPLAPEIIARLDELLRCHLNDLDVYGIFSIPGSSYHPFRSSDRFDLLHIQSYGLLNDGSVCALISLVLSLHRLGLKNHIADPLPQTPDLPTMVLKKILTALPSQDPFSLQSFISSWNNSEKCPKISQGNSDVIALAEAIISNLPIKHEPTQVPFLTQFCGSYRCSECGLDHDRVKTWEGQIGSVIPLLSLSDSEDHVDLTSLMRKFLTETFETRCSNSDCRSIIRDGRIVPVKGLFTILGLNRFDIDNPNRKKKQGLFSLMLNVKL